MAEKKDVVKFGREEYTIPTGCDEKDVREAFADIHAAISHATLNKVDNGDDTFTWEFAQTAGTKGC